MHKSNIISTAVSAAVAMSCWVTTSSPSFELPNPNFIFVIAFPIPSTPSRSRTTAVTTTTTTPVAAAFNTHKHERRSGQFGRRNGSQKAFVLKDNNHHGGFVNVNVNQNNGSQKNRSRLQVAMTSSPSSSSQSQSQSQSSYDIVSSSPYDTRNGHGLNSPIQNQQQQLQQQQQQQQQQNLPATNEVFMTPAEHALQNNINGGNNGVVDTSTFLDQPQPIQDTFTYNLPPSAAQTLDGRLLCASQCAYSIKQPYFKSSAYRPATTAKRITKGVNSVLIGHTYDGITIAFRGTQSSSPIDWLQNAALFLSNVDPIVGKVHTGFYRASKSLWKPLRGVLREMLEESRVNGWKQNIYLTGHSKGGALATVAAILMKRDKELPDPTYVCAFASAKVGDSEFCMEYNKEINQTSYEAHLDLIPFLPPSENTMDMMSEQMTEMMDSMLWTDTSLNKKDKYKWDYQTVGKRKFITKDYDIIDEVTKELDEKRIQEIEKFSFLSLDEFKSAHCSSCASEGCNGYYFHAIAGEVCAEDECTIDEMEESSEKEQKQQQQE